MSDEYRATSRSTADVFYGNPFVFALADLVAGYDPETQTVPLVSYEAARLVVSGDLPEWWRND